MVTTCLGSSCKEGLQARACTPPRAASLHKEGLGVYVVTWKDAACSVVL